MIQFTVAELVNQYDGKPFAHKGRGPDAFDCWGLIIDAYASKGVAVFDLEDYEVEWARRGKNIILDNYYENWQKVTAPMVGDVILFHYPRPDSKVQHAGIFLEYGRFIHAANIGIIQSTIHEWKDRVHGYYRWIDLKTKPSSM